MLRTNRDRGSAARLEVDCQNALATRCRTGHIVARLRANVGYVCVTSGVRAILLATCVGSQVDLGLLCHLALQAKSIRALREHLPAAWMIGVGVSFSFMARDLKRAPVWMRKAGLKWIHRMLQDPRRLVGRYLFEDLPFALRLFPHAFLSRMRRRG